MQWQLSLLIINSSNPEEVVPHNKGKGKARVLSGVAQALAAAWIHCMQAQLREVELELEEMMEELD